LGNKIMTIELILFIISLAGIGTMLYIKVREINHGHVAYPLKVRDSVDTFVERVTDDAHHLSQKINHISMATVVTRMMRTITMSSRLIYKTALMSENKIINFIKGRRTLVRNNHRSEFLDSIEEHKRENGSGEIEE